MIGLVNSVAELVSLRDRDELEISVALMAAGSLEAGSAKLWRVLEDRSELRLHARLAITDRSIMVSDPPDELSDLPRLDSRREMRVCYDRKAPTPVSPDANGGRRYVFPVMGAKGVIGFLEISSEAQAPVEKLRFITDLLRIYRNQLEILDYSENDELTGLPNRKTFDAAFARMTRIEAPRAARIVQYERIERRRTVDADQPRWLAVLDVDFFKSINDRFGHHCGDAVLVALANLMRASFRAADRVFRCGGEEFVVILEPTDPQFVASVLERFRGLVAVHHFPEVGALTVSIGYTQVAIDDDGSAAFRRADEALYAAKRQGRNRVIFYEDMKSGGAGPASPVSAESEARARLRAIDI
jgi:diguanylate cyclase (GGDEF)-like protein